MRIGKRLLLFCAVAALLFGVLTACGRDSSPTNTETAQKTEPTTSAAQMPQAATFVAEMPGEDDYSKMYLAVSVEGENVVAYACNGVDDSAWFFGTQKDGSMELTSAYQDALTAKFDGTNLAGTLTMNEADAKPLNFSAMQQAEPAGLFTATEGDARASWVVMADGRMYGVTQPNSRNDREVIDKINAQQQQFKDQVRQARLDRQLQQAPKMNLGNKTADMGGRQVTAVRVTGNMRSLPNSN